MAKVLVGVSGGVDSSVVLGMLQAQGHEVVAYTLKLLENTDSEDNNSACCSFNDMKDAALCCDKLGVDYIVSSWKKQFREKVIDSYLNGVRAGIATNPCITCNSTIKLPVLLAVANHFNCDYVATGHYAQIKNGKIARAANLKKDQSYFLWQMPENIVHRFMFPLGNISSKNNTRDMARIMGLDHVANKPDSTDLCFFAGGSKDEFLASNGIEAKSGNVVCGNKVVGTHNGYTNYTCGQKINGKFVLRVVPETNVLVVGNREECYNNEVALNNFRMPENPNNIQAVLRYHSEPVQVESLSIVANQLVVKLSKAVFAPTKGQSCVFYSDDCVVGGGIIA